MNLKSYPRPQYNVNPIFEAVCQLRFPPILKILENPVAFQDRIRAEYPNYETSNGLPEDLPREVQEMMRRSGFGGTADLHHRFISEDKIWQISLGKNYISLTNAGEYQSFEDFFGRLDRILEAFDAEYKPSFYNRIGLRYRNIIAKKVFPEIESLFWKDIIPMNVAPELHDPEITESKVADFEKKIAFHEGDEKINLFHVFSKISGDFKGINFENEQSYIIDIDSYTEVKKDDRTAIRTTINSFKDNIQNLFRHSISDELHKSLQAINRGETARAKAAQ